MKKIGILTFHHLRNFGAYWQAWASVQTLIRLGCDVRVIDYRPESLRKKRRGFRAYLPSPGRIRMRRYMERHLPLTETLMTHEEVARHVDSAGYDCLVTGSDQVWMVGGHMRFDPVYFLDVGDPQRTRRISYAPSCGSITSFDRHREEINGLVRRFHALSGRDARTLGCLADLGVTNVTRVVDPTLLANFDEFREPAHIRGDYVAVVGGMNDASAVVARGVADRLGCRLVAVGTRCPTADKELRYADQGVWLNSLANARFVISSLFHGAVISMRLGTPFLAVDAAGRSFKLLDLFEHFGLEDRFVAAAHAGGEITEAMLEYDAAATHDRLRPAVNASLEYLRVALDG